MLSTVNTFELSSVGSDHFLFDEIFLVSKLMLLELCLLIFPLKFILFYFVGVLTSNCYPSFTLFLLHVNIYLFFHFLSSAPYSFLVGCVCFVLCRERRRRDGSRHRLITERAKTDEINVLSLLSSYLR